MAEQLLVVRAARQCPYGNIAAEKLLMDAVAPGQVVLYLWRNARTVVIGRNQSAHAEVNLSELERDGGKLARRYSGGGAVYHDLGNLNFTFIARRDAYDVTRQTQVIVEAVRALGVDAQVTGRNDVLVGGRKFSGHAYYRSGEACYHHGTLMVDVDVEQLSRYLRPSADKLLARGVRSVRSRVTNLVDIVPTLTVAQLDESLCAAFAREYGGVPREQAVDEVLDASALHELAERLASPAWLLRDEQEFAHVARERFAWGGVTLRYTLEEGRICACSIASDGLEADYLEAVPALLAGCEFSPAALEAALAAQADTEQLRTIAHDIAHMLCAPREGMQA